MAVGVMGTALRGQAFFNQKSYASQERKPTQARQRYKPPWESPGLTWLVLDWKVSGPSVGLGASGFSFRIENGGVQSSGEKVCSHPA